MATPASSCCPTEWLHKQSCSGQHHDDSPPCACNQCGFCKDRTIEWNDCTMHNPATGSQTAKDFDAMHKSTQTSKLLDNQSSTRRPASLPCHERNSHSSYHADNHHCSGKHSRSHSHLHSHSRSHDCFDDDCCSQRSSSHHCSDTFVGHHDF